MDELEFSKAISDKNFLGIYSLIKNSDLSKVEKDVRFGRLVKIILDELELTKFNSDKNVFYRSIIYLIAKEIPDLQESYRIQQRLVEPSIPASSLFKSVGNLSDVVRGKKTIYEGISDGIENVKEVIEGSEDLNGSSDVLTNSIVNAVNGAIKNFEDIFSTSKNKKEE